MKKILFVSAFPPCNRTAGQNYTSQLLNDLSKDNEIDIVYWNYPDHVAIISSEANVVTTITLSKMKKVINALCAFVFFPLFTVRFNWRLCNQIRKRASRYDVIYFDFSQVFLYSLFIKHSFKVFMCHDVISQKYSRRRLSFLYLWMVKLTEKVLLNTASLRLCFSEKDVDYIKNEFKLDAIKVSFYISDQVRNAYKSEEKIYDYFVLFGAWNRPENYDGLLWLCDNVLPECDIRCVVIGGGMSEAQMRRVHSDKVQCVGFVDDPYPLIYHSACLLAPLFQGAGVKVKVVEALALGTPVIGTEIAFEGIDDIMYSGNKRALNLANDKETFISQIQNYIIPSVGEKKEIINAFNRNYQSKSMRLILSKFEGKRTI